MPFTTAGIFRGRSTAFGKSWLVWKIEQWTAEHERRAGNPISGRVLSDPYKDRLIVRKCRLIFPDMGDFAFVLQGSEAHAGL